MLEIISCKDQKISIVNHSHKIVIIIMVCLSRRRNHRMLWSRSLWKLGEVWTCSWEFGAVLIRIMGDSMLGIRKIGPKLLIRKRKILYSGIWGTNLYDFIVFNSSLVFCNLLLTMFDICRYLSIKVKHFLLMNVWFTLLSFYYM